MNKIERIYHELLAKYGPQGWWPIVNPKTLICEYHVGAPRNQNDVFEICIGSILTQNTSWTNVEKALKNLKKASAINIKGFKKLSDGKLKELIKCAGYFNQKAKKLRIFTDFFSQLNDVPAREELLGLWGIGPETADSILLYAYKQTHFVVDTYTKRMFPEFKDADYEIIREKFEKALPKDFKIYQEYHALIVEHMKNVK